MRTVRTAATILLACLATLMLGSPARAQATDERMIVWVEVNKNVSPALYDTYINKAIRIYNSHTVQTKMVRGKCVDPSPFFCIKVFMSDRLINKGAFAEAQEPGFESAGWVKFTSKSSRATPSERVRMVIHEFGHARYLPHSRSCNSAMFTWVRCNGRLVPHTFLTSEINILRSF